MAGQRPGSGTARTFPGSPGLLFRDFLRWLKMKYIMPSFHPLVFYYALGVVFTILGVLGGLYSLYYKFVQEHSIFIPAVVSLLLFGLGAQLWLFAMLFDMEWERNSNGWYV